MTLIWSNHNCGNNLKQVRSRGAVIDLSTFVDIGDLIRYHFFMESAGSHSTMFASSAIATTSSL